MEDRKEEVAIEKRTIEELLAQLREEKNWTYMHIVEKLQELEITINEKQVKKWEIGLEYPELDVIYKLSELYMVPSQTFIMAKSNSYEKGLASVHMMFIKWFCYITGFSIKVTYYGLFVILGLALIWSLNFFIGNVELFLEVRARMNH